MLETIYISRHGFRANFEGAHWIAPTGTERDVPLTAHGHIQAKELADHLVSSRIKIDAILSSPYYRCLVTAAPLAERLAKRIWVEDGIGEWYLPASKGLHPALLPPSELQELVPSVSPSSHSALLRPTRRGETAKELHERTRTLLELLVAYLDSHPERPTSVLLMTHAATNIALGRALVDDRPSEDGKVGKDIRTGTCSLGKYVRGADAQPGRLGVWGQELNGDCSFLSKGEERNWAFDFVEAYDEDGCLPDDPSEPRSFVVNPYGDPRNPSSVDGPSPSSPSPSQKTAAAKM